MDGLYWKTYWNGWFGGKPCFRKHPYTITPKEPPKKTSCRLAAAHQARDDAVHQPGPWRIIKQTKFCRNWFSLEWTLFFGYVYIYIHIYIRILYIYCMFSWDFDFLQHHLEKPVCFCLLLVVCRKPAAKLLELCLTWLIFANLFSTDWINCQQLPMALTFPLPTQVSRLSTRVGPHSKVTSGKRYQRWNPQWSKNVHQHSGIRASYSIRYRASHVLLN